MLVPNDVAVIPTYVKLRRPIHEAKLIPEQWRRNAETEAQWGAGQDVPRAGAELTGPVTLAAPIVGSVIGHTDLTSADFLGLQERFKS